MNPGRSHLCLAWCASLVMATAATAQTPTAGGPPLTLREAEQLALTNHPRVLAAHSEALERRQEVREARSAYFPALSGVLTGSQTNQVGARVGAGILPASQLFDRFGQGVLFSQLITDSGRTPHLVSSSKLHAQAGEQNDQATQFDILLGVNTAYFDVLRDQALVRVAQETVSARQLLADQVTTLAQNNLRSQLDVSFADVNVSDAKLLLLAAQNTLQDAYAQMARALGADQVVEYQLADEPVPASLPTDPNALVAQAVATRPDLARLRFERDAAYQFAGAEADLARPTVSAVGVAGFLPYINQPATAAPIPSKYEGAAVMVEVPVLNGGLFAARHTAAELRAREADQQLRDAQEGVAHDVRVALASASTAFQRMDVTAQFMRSATLGLDLAQGRYNLGLSSIVELTQAQLNLTRAAIENLDAKYDYQSDYAMLQYTLGLLR
jgi:outer membrane protein